MRAIEVCRTAALGGHVEQCQDCRHQLIAYNSCRNRHCPKCQNGERAKWLENRAAELLAQEFKGNNSPTPRGYFDAGSSDGTGSFRRWQRMASAR